MDSTNSRMKCLGDINEYFNVVKSIPSFEYVIKYMSDKDFFTAPASVRYHSSYKGGLSDHSANVVYYLLMLTEKLNLKWQRPESPYIIGVLHDLCKVEFYSVSERNTKDKDGKWIKEPFYSVEERNPLGHGSKSVILAQALGCALTMEEIYCIVYHMQAFGDRDYQNNYSSAIKKVPLIIYVALADQLAGLYESGALVGSFF